MAGKKKGKKKGKKGDGAATPTPKADSPAPGGEFEPMDVAGDEPSFVTLRCELLNWKFSAFTLRLPLSTPLFSLREKIADRHGPVTDLKMYVDQAVDKNELKGEFERLESFDLGGSEAAAGEGGAEGEAEPDVRIVYDFRPVHHDNPLLL